MKPLWATRRGRHRLCIARGASLLALVAASILSSPAESQERFAVHGSNTIGAELMPALIEGFAGSVGYRITRAAAPDNESERIRARFGVEPTFEIDLQRRGSSTSFRGLTSGAALIGMSSRRVKGGEVESIKAISGVDLRTPGSEHVIALDGLTIIVSAENPLPAVSMEIAARIFAGDIKDWSEVGLPPGPIKVHARDNNSGTWDTFKSLVLKPAGVELTASATRYLSNQKLAEAVAADPRSIGFVPLAFADLAKTVPIALECGMIVRPDAFTVKAEEYPLGRRLYLYTIGPPNRAEAVKLVDYAVSDKAQPIISRVGFVDQSIEYQDTVAYSNHIIGAMQAARGPEETAALKTLISIANVKRRLSVTFRFAPGGVLLDAKSVADAGRLARWMVLPENRQAKVSLLGFADSVGGYSSNLALSLERARAVRRAILIQAPSNLDPGRIELRGFSTIAPIACNSTARGRAANRRVEVWTGN